MGTSVAPDAPASDELDKALAALRAKQQPDAIDSALDALRHPDRGDITLAPHGEVTVSQPKGVVGPRGETLIPAESMSKIASGEYGLAPAIGAAIRLGRGRPGYENIGNVPAGEKTDLPVVTADQLEAPNARASLSKDIRRRTAPGLGSTASNLALTAGLGLVVGPETTSRAEDTILERYTEGGGDASKNAKLLGAASAFGAGVLQAPLVVTPSGAVSAPETGARLIWGAMTKDALGAAAKRVAASGASAGATLAAEGAVGDIASGQDASTVAKRAAANAALGFAGGSILHGLGEANAAIGAGDAMRAARAQQTAREHPDWVAGGTPADVETRPSRLLENPNKATATAKVTGEQPPATEPDYTVDEPNSPIQAKGVFGGALEQHGQHFVEKATQPQPEPVVAAPAPAEAPAVNNELQSRIDLSRAKGWPDPTPDAQQQLGDGAWDISHEETARELGMYAQSHAQLSESLAAGIDPKTGKPWKSNKTAIARKASIEQEVQHLDEGYDAILGEYHATFGSEGLQKFHEMTGLPPDITGPVDVKRLQSAIADPVPLAPYVDPAEGLPDQSGEMDHALEQVRAEATPAAEEEARPIEQPPKEPVHETARTASGKLRENLHSVKSDGLVHEMFKLLGAEDQRDQMASIYRNVEADVGGSQDGVHINVATRHGDGASEEAKALHRIELKKGAAARIEAVLNARGLTDEDITRRYVELTETAADLAAEREGLDADKGDTSFDVAEFADKGNSKGNGAVAQKGTDTGAEGAPEGSAEAPGRRESSGPPAAEGDDIFALERAQTDRTAWHDELANRRRDLYADLFKARTPDARFQVLESLKKLEKTAAAGPPTMKGAITAEEMADRARAGETREAVQGITGAEPVKLSTDKQQSEIFGESQTPAAVPKPAADQNDLFSLERPAHDLAFERMKSDVQTIISALDDAVPLGGSNRLYDTSGIASRQLMLRLAAKPHTRELAVSLQQATFQVLSAIAGRYPFPLPEFGGISIDYALLGMNLARAGIAQKARAYGLPYKGSETNLLLLNPYMSLVEIGATGKYFTDVEMMSPLAESSFATIVHEVAHQLGRKEDERFTAAHTRFAGAAAGVAHQVLEDLRQAWKVALKAGIREDVVTLENEVWNVARKTELNELRSHFAAEGPPGDSDRLPVGSDADASHVRPPSTDSELGPDDGRRRLGPRFRSDVPGGGGSSESARSPGATAADAARLGAREGRAATPASEEGVTEGLRLPEPSGLSQPRTAIRPTEFVRALKSFFNPESLGPEALGAGGTIKHQSAEAYRRLAISTHALKSFQARIDKMTREEQVQLWDDAEHGRPTGDPILDEGNRILRKATDERTKQLVAFDRLKAEKTIENYVGRFWSQTAAGSGRDFLRAIRGRRPFEGPKSFTKQRDLDWFVEGLKRPDLIPATYNYVESQLAKIAEMERVISAEHTLRQEQELGRAKPIMLGQEPPFDAHGDPWVKIDRTGEDPAFVVYLPPEVKHWEAVDTLVYGKLQKLIDSLSVRHLRTTKIGGTRLGYAQGDKFIATKFGGAEGVVVHEVGHILDARYGLGDQIDKAIGAAPKRTVTKGKKAGKQVPDYKSEGKDAGARRKALREELRQLANLRRETLSGVPTSKELGATDRAYLHSGPEKMANMVEAYVSARDRFRHVAPGIFEIFDRIVGEHPELHPLRDIQPSLSREEHGATTRVSGIITGGHWYAPRDAAAVWQNHLSKGLAGNPIYDAAIAPIHAGTQMLLGFSGFHGTVIATEGAFSDLALATDNLVNKGGKAHLAPMQVARAAISPLAGVTFGRKVMQEYRIPGTHPELKQVLDAMIAGGFRGRATSELWSGDRKDKLKRAFRDTLHAESKGRRLWGATRLPFDAIWAGVEFASGPLMSKYVPLMKTAATYNAVAQALEKLPPDAPIDVMHRVMGDVVKEMDYRFGQVDYDNHFINRVAKDLAQLVFLAPGWTFGTLALAGRGLSDVAKIPKRALKLAAGAGGGPDGEEPPPELIGHSAAYWIGAVLGTMLINGALTYWSTGERPHGKDYWAFRDGTKDAAGNWNRHTVPGYLMHDIYGWSKHPVHTFKNKFAPTLAFFARLAENKDYFGDMIYDPEATLPTKLKQAGKALLKQHAPLSAQNYLEGKKRGEGGTAEVARNVFGVTPARRELIRTEAQNKMAEYLGRHSPETRTPDEVENGEIHGDVVDAIRKGDELPKPVLDALASGRLKRRTLFKWLGDARQSSIVSQFKRLSVEEAERVWDLANPDEKALWAQAYRTKVVNAGRQ